MSKDASNNVSDTAAAKIAALPRMMTVSDAANLMGLTSWDVHQLVSSGTLAAVHVGKRSSADRAEAIWLHPRDVRNHLSTLA